MLPSMLTNRGQPLPRPIAGWSVVVTFVLIGVALAVTVWITRSSVVDASDALQRGQALALEQAVRADLVDLDGLPTKADLETILKAHADDGLRYIGRIDDRIIVEEAGTAVGTSLGEAAVTMRRERFVEVGDRLRLIARPFPQMRGGRRPYRLAIEIEPVQARDLRDTATLAAGVGIVAAMFLLAVALYLVRREALRNREERDRERERRLASLGEMSAVLAHEIKNPLASLKGNAQLLKSMFADDASLKNPGKAKSKAERVVDEAVRLEQLVGDLLEFVRTGEIRRVDSDPGAVVHEAAISVAAAAEHLEIDTERAPRSWSLDAGRIREVIVNLVDNAAAAGPPVKVTVSTERSRLVIEVADQGPGIAADDREKIFEPFFTGKTQGTGLGLAVVRRVIEQHGGSISVLANPGGGALFRIEIPDR